jgi:hypothetical protein
LKPGGDAAQITPAEVAAAARASLGQSDRDSLTTEVAEEWMAHLLPKNVKNASFFYFGVKHEARGAGRGGARGGRAADLQKTAQKGLGKFRDPLNHFSGAPLEFYYRTGARTP